LENSVLRVLFCAITFVRNQHVTRNTTTRNALNMKKAIFPPNAAKPIAPYTPAVLANGTLYLSGQIALDEAGNLHTADIATETRQVMNNLGNLLTAADMGYENLVKITILLSDMSLYAAVNEVYGSYFTDMPPAREAVAVKGLPRGVNVEISGIAYKG
jgi:2-iminobutanoate/2-iminopropanoate deaminase